MRHIGPFILILSILSAAANAASEPLLVRLAHTDSETATAYEFEDNETKPATGQRAYDNWRSPNDPEEKFRGNTLLPLARRIGSDEIGDDLVLSNVGESVISDIGYSYANLSTTGTLTSYRLSLRWYDDQLNLLGQTSFTVATRIGPGLCARVFTSGNDLLGLNIPVAPRMFMTTQFSEVRGIDAADIGVLYGGPVSTGSSSQFYRNFTTGQLVDLGSENQNLGFFIDTVPIPGPGGVTVMAVVMGVVGCRRRR